MARAGGEIAGRLGRPVADKDRARRREPRQEVARPRHHQLEVLGGEAVAQLGALVERRHNHQQQTRLQQGRDATGAGQLRCLPGELVADPLGQLGTVRDQERLLVSRAVLELREQVGRDPVGLGRLVGKDRDFTGTGDKVEGHMAVDLPLGGGDKSPARADDLLDGPDRLRAESHQADRLDAADAVDFGCTCHPERMQQDGIDAPVLAAGGAGDDLADAGHLGQRGGHDGRRGQRRGTAGDVDADTV